MPDDLGQSTDPATVPDKGERVRVVKCLSAPCHIGKLSTVERFYLGQQFPVGIVFDDDATRSVFVFRPNELEVVDA